VVEFTVALFAKHPCVIDLLVPVVFLSHSSKTFPVNRFIGTSVPTPAFVYVATTADVLVKSKFADAVEIVRYVGVITIPF
jgi:hypothetical protein